MDLKDCAEEIIQDIAKMTDEDFFADYIEATGDKLIQYYVVNSELGMSIGKTAGQVAHACLVDTLKYQEDKLFKYWKATAMTKVILKGTEKDLIGLKRTFGCTLIVDKGWTEIPPDSKTVLVFPVMWKSQAPEQIKKMRLL